MTLKSYRICLCNDLAELEKLADFVQDYGSENELAWRDVHDVMLTLEELVTNVISYGFSNAPQAASAEIVVELNHEDSHLTLAVIDNGHAFNPLEDAPEVNIGAPLEERGIGGLGIHLVKNLMDSMEYAFRNERNHLVMRKRLGKYEEK